MQQLSGQDAMFLHTELDGLPQHIGGVSIYDQSTAKDGIVRFKEILTLIQSRAHLSPIFRRKLVTVPFALDKPYWAEDPNFDIEYHVRHIALPKPGNWRQLCILVARLHSRPLSRDKPLWEIYVIEGLDNVEGLPPGCFALLIKVHHSAMDGPSGIEFMSAIHDLSPEPEPRGAAPPPVLENPSMIGLLGRAYLNGWRKPKRVYDMLRQAAPAYLRIRKGKKQQDFKSLDDKQKTRFQGKISPHRVVDACKFNFEEVRAIKNSMPGTTINDVMLTIVGGGLRKYLESNGELPKQTLVSGCPIDVRTESERSAGGNMVGFMNVALRTEIEGELAIAKNRFRTVFGKTIQENDVNGLELTASYRKLVPASQEDSINMALESNPALKAKALDRNIADSEIEPAPTLGAKIQTNFIKGMAREEDGFIIILDISQVLSAEEIALVSDMHKETILEE